MTGHLPGLDVKAGRSLCGGLSAILILVLAALFLLGSSLPSASADTVKDVQLVYFYPRIRCVSCENVEAYAAEAAATYSGHGQEGIPYTQLAIDDPANGELVERYGVVGSSLFLVVGSIEEGEFEELKKVWFLYEDRDGCISYIQEEIDTAFSEGAASGIALIQVCADMADGGTCSREIDSLRAAMAETRTTEGTIVTMYDETTLAVPEGTIRAVPAWRWALD